MSLNTYLIPFDGKIDVRPAPFHFENPWLKNSVDFALIVGTPILSSMGGIVHEVIDGFEEGGPNKSFLGKSNLVILEHPFGEYSAYVHLRKGLLIEKGQSVSKGQILGYSGLSGFTSYPHLHYNTMILDAESESEWITIPTIFNILGKNKVIISPKE